MYSIHPPKVLCYTSVVIYGTSTQWYYILTLQQVRLEIQLSLKKMCWAATSRNHSTVSETSSSTPLWINSHPLHLKLFSQPIVNNQPVIDFSVSLSWVCERPAIAVLKVPYIPDCFVFFNLKLKLNYFPVILSPPDFFSAPCWKRHSGRRSNRLWPSVVF